MKFLSLTVLNILKVLKISIFIEKFALDMDGEVHLAVDPGVTPVQMPLRRLPVALRDQVTRSSADADNGLDAFVGQSRSTNISGPFQVK